MRTVGVLKLRAIAGAAVLLMLAVPAGARADETIGSELVHDPAGALNAPVVWIQQTLVSPFPLRASADGTLASVKLKTQASGEYALQVQRPSLGYRVMAQTPMLHVDPENPVTTLTVATHLPIAAGDQIGVRDPAGHVVGLFGAGPSVLLGAITSDPANLSRGGDLPQISGGLGAELLVQGSIDTDEPPTYRTTITSGPAAQTDDATPTFAFTSTVPKTYECRVEPEPWAPCTSPMTTASLAQGSHTFVVRGTDAAGNTDAALQTFKVDTTAPTISCGTASSQWLAANAAIGCTASDGGSGLAVPSQSSVTLHTNVAAGSEDANASTNSVSICDVAGNCATAGPVGGNKIDHAEVDGLGVVGDDRHRRLLGLALRRRSRRSRSSIPI
jgi:hypothetical protein